MDPISVVGAAASIIGIAQLAESIVSKGYKYLKAVKNCEEEVHKLMVEINVLSGLLKYVAPDDEDEEEEDSVSKFYHQWTDHPSSLFNFVLDLESPTPNYIYECQKTLNEVKLILEGFERKANPAPSTPSSTVKSVVKRKGKVPSNFSRLSMNDLKWPLSKSSTLALIESLQRHKTSCILGLCSEQTSNMHSILSNVNGTSEKLDEIQKGQGELLKAQITEEHGKIISWLSPVNPVEKHAIFLAEYQEGTGLWIFDRNEYKAWEESQNGALYVYGIPGAGKTTLATLVVETMTTQKPKGLAYFYGRHDDPASQHGPNILGSLLAQLAIQEQDAIEAVLEFYKKHNPKNKLATKPTEKELWEAIQSLTSIFEDITLIIDGLDECGTRKNRAPLLEVLSAIPDTESSQIRILVFGRAESDIVQALQPYTSISIEAASTDLQLYVAARLRNFKTKSETLKEEIMDTLSNHARGM
jgi:hypothetical protein